MAWVPFPSAGPPDERTGVSTAHRLFAIGAFVEDVQARFILRSHAIHSQWLLLLLPVHHLCSMPVAAALRRGNDVQLIKPVGSPALAAHV